MLQMENKDIDKGWAYVVLASSFFIHVICYGIAWSTGVYTGIFLEVFHQPHSLTAWIVALPAAVMYVTGLIASVLTNKYGFRLVLIVGAVMVSVGLCLCYFANNLYVIALTFGVITGAGVGLVYIPAMAALTCYFDKKITLAAGISTSGVGVGNFIYPPLIRWLVNTYDWKQSFLILGAISLNMCALGALIRPVKRFEINKSQPILNLSPFKKVSYIMVCVNIFLYCSGISILFVHVVAYGESMGIDPDKSALLISGLGIANLIGHLVYGAVAQHPRVNCFIAYSVSFFLSGVCICLVPVLKSYPLLMASTVIFGALSGCYGTLLVKILIDLLGLHRFSNGYGCLLLFMAAGQVVGPSLAGALIDVTYSYTLAFVLGGAMVILSAFAMIQPYLYVKNRKSAKEDIYESERVSLGGTTNE